MISDKPPPCTLFYLAECKFGDECKYGHHYELTPDDLEEIRRNAKKGPCPSVNKGTRRANERKAP